MSLRGKPHDGRQHPALRAPNDLDSIQLNRRATGANDKFKSSLILPSVGPHLFIWGFDGTNTFLRDNGWYII